jgi:hypothetical protein
MVEHHVNNFILNSMVEHRGNNFILNSMVEHHSHNFGKMERGRINQKTHKLMVDV